MSDILTGRCTLSRHLPVVAPILGCGALLLGLLPGAPSILQFDRAAIGGAGQLWRLLTGHFVHWSADHILWDLAMFVVLGSLCEVRSRRLFLWSVAGSAVAISAGVWLLLPQMAFYRGLSGIDSALFVLLAGMLLRQAWQRQDRRLRWAVVVAAAGFAAKTVFELTTRSAVFVDCRTAGVIPVPLAHVIGVATGLAAIGAMPLTAGLDDLSLWRRTRRRAGRGCGTSAPLGCTGEQPAPGSGRGHCGRVTRKHTDSSTQSATYLSTRVKGYWRRGRDSNPR